MVKFTTSNTVFEYRNYPAECPECKNNIHPLHHHHIEHPRTKNSYVFLQCPNSESCGVCFVYEFEYLTRVNTTNSYSFKKMIKGTYKISNISERITAISPNFVQIYNQSETAEYLSLFQICGVGYRKALEYLIKDYLITQNPTNEENIKKSFLGKCISDFVSNEKIKSTAKRAVWLGNDETHYVRQWIDKDLRDMKTLIELTIHWIEMELLTKEFESSMPE